MNHEIICTIVKQLVSPWTVLLVIAIIMFRRELSKLFTALVGFAENTSVFDVKYKDIKLSAQRRDEMAERLLSAGPPANNTEGMELKDGLKRLAASIRNNVSDKDLSLFATIFVESDDVVVPVGSRAEDSLVRLADGGAVKRDGSSLQTPTGTRLQTWKITEAGKALRNEL